VAGGFGFEAKYNQTQDQFGNVTNSTYHNWMSSNAAGVFTAQYANNRVSPNSSSDKDRLGTVIPQTWTYDNMGNRTRLSKTTGDVTIQELAFDALGRGVPFSRELDGEGNITSDDIGLYHIRSTVFGGEIVASVTLNGDKNKGRVLEGGHLIAEQIINVGTNGQFVWWHHRDPLNLVSRDTYRETDGTAQVKRVHAITPTGAQVETSEGVNLTNYYACLYAPGSPSCNSYYQPQPPGGYGPDKDKEHGILAGNLKVDGVLTLWSLSDIARQIGRSGVGSISLGPALAGTPLSPGGAGGSWRKREIWTDVPSDDPTQIIARDDSVYDWVPGGSGVGSELQAGSSGISSGLQASRQENFPSFQLTVPPLEKKTPCGVVNPITGQPGFTPTPRGVQGNLRPGVRGQGHYLAPRNGGRQHQGLDIYGHMASPIHASHDGTIVRVDNNASPGSGYGRLIEIRGDNGVTTRYAHNTINLLPLGNGVRAGQVIALLGQTGNASGQPLTEAHVHFEVKVNGRRGNPNTFLNTSCGWQINP
jgi:hypothetical protein